MKKRLIKTSNWIYGALISLLGFSQGCSNSGPLMYGSPIPEYDSPQATYIISGKVTNEAHTPINDIKVIVKSENDLLIKALDTNDQGEYRFELTGTETDVTYNLTYLDQDGTANGGDFINRSDIKVAFKNEDFTGGDDTLNKGEANKVIDIVMEEKTN